MDRPQYTTLRDALQAIPDPRHARGKCYPWHFLLMLIALASGEKAVHAMADWIVLHVDEWRSQLGWHEKSFPSESTIRRTLRFIAPTQLETILAGLPDTAPAPVESDLTGQSVDGKVLFGASAHGRPVQLVSL